MFDTISYCKGASVVRMLHDTVGADVFAKGIRIYLKRFAYRNAKTGDSSLIIALPADLCTQTDFSNSAEDLWIALSEASGADIAAMMHPWIRRTGYPVV